MLILRAFSLSFSILWRFMIVLPFLIVFLIFYVLLSIFWGIFAILISPLLTIAIILAMTFVMGMIPLMVGTRLGLEAREETVEGSYVNLFLPALGYGAFEAVAKLVITFGAAGLFALLYGSGSANEVTALAVETLDPFAEFSSAGGVTGGGWVFLITSVLFILLRAAFLPAYAGAAGGRDPNGQAHTPFSGTGVRFFSLVLLIIVIYLLALLILPVGFVIAAQLGVDELVMARFVELMEMTQTGRSYSFAPIDGVMGAIFLVYALWLFSLQCAGAVLVQQERRLIHEAERSRKPAVERMDPDVLREMVRSRMPQRKY